MGGQAYAFGQFRPRPSLWIAGREDFSHSVLEWLTRTIFTSAAFLVLSPLHRHTCFQRRRQQAHRTSLTPDFDRIHVIRPSPITPGDGFRVATVEHQCIPSTGARHSCVDDTTVFGIGDDDGGDSLRASSSILTTSFPGGNTASALIAAEELSTLHSLVVKKAADVSARERTLMQRQSAMGAEIVKAQQMIQDLAARLLVDAQSSLNSTAGKLTKR
ncbi:Endoplasmic reticulum mannosyl-oligosaccharide 1,2-alpha-mannosidase, partial [Perkinsus olseni]